MTITRAAKNTVAIILTLVLCLGRHATAATTSSSTTKDVTAFAIDTNRKWGRPRPRSRTFVSAAQLKSDRNNKRVRSNTAVSTSAAATESDESQTAVAPPRKTHVVEGISCVELVIPLPSPVNSVTVLEATAESQETLVDLALLLDEELEELDDVGASGRLDGIDVRLSKGDPYGAVLWPAASAVASHLLREPKNSAADATDALPLKGLTILELGAGTGLVSLACIKAGAASVIATDYEEIPLMLLRYAADGLNDIDANGDGDAPLLTTQVLDMCDASPLPAADVVVASDVLYDLATARCVARRTIEALERGSRVVVGCSPGRPGRPVFLEELREGLRNLPLLKSSSLGMEDLDFVDTEGWTCPDTRHELICGKGSTSVSDVPKLLTIKLLDLTLSSLLDN